MNITLRCGCTVTVWPHGKGDSPAAQAEVTAMCRAHGTDVVAKIRERRRKAKNNKLGACTDTYFLCLETEIETYDAVLRLLKGPEPPAR